MTQTLPFTKMHGLGNDFMVLDATKGPLPITPKLIRKLSDRHTGIGFDQCLVVAPAQSEDYDFHYQVYNADGSEVSQCGNGARCLAIFIRDKHLSDKSQYLVRTNNGELLLAPQTEDQVWVEFDEPAFEPEQIPLHHDYQADYYPFTVRDESHYLHCLSVGNPHGVLIVDELNDELIHQYGLALSQHPKFIEGANISFICIQDKQHAKLRVFERGVGETQACGSAALASAAALRLFHKAAKRIYITLPGGTLMVEWQGLGHKIHFTGPAVSVFDGILTL